MRPPLPVLLLLVAGLLACFPGTGYGQGWQWPETSVNLQVLPSHTTADELKQTMRLFVAGLGVRCSHCHVGEEGQSLATFDFASDAKPAKEKARVMIRMVQAINEEHLATLAAWDVAPENLLRVTCETCHRGIARPEALENVLATTLATDGVEAMRATYADLRTRYYGAYAYNFSETTLHGLGIQLLRSDRATEAVAVFHLNREQFPASSRAAAGLAEAYMAADQPEQARVFFEEALRLDPSNSQLVARLKSLQP